MDDDSDDDDCPPTSTRKRRRRTSGSTRPSSVDQVKRQRPKALPKQPAKKTTVANPLPQQQLVNDKEAVLRIVARLMQKGQVSHCPHSQSHVGLTVGSACSGWCSELLALQRMGKAYTCCFACDNDPHVKALCSRSFQHCHWFDDVTSDAFLRTPGVDLFFAGFPCQPFSNAGLCLGISEERGVIFIFVIRYIAQTRPRCFVLENVEGLLHRHKDTLILILDVLTSLVDSSGRRLYDISWKLLDTAKYSGLPHNRHRVFIVGILKTTMVAPMTWPEPVTWCIKKNNGFLRQF